MAYTKTTWTDGSTQLNATNMNHIETGVKDAHDGKITVTENTVFTINGVTFKLTISQG